MEKQSRNIVIGKAANSELLEKLPASVHAGAGSTRRIIYMEKSLKLASTARKLKVTAIVDATPFAALRAIPDNAPPRTELTIAIDGRTVTADLSTRSVRKAVKTLTDNGSDNVVLILQGVLTPSNRIEEAGIVAQVKVQAPAGAD
jgi:hypothetical protein